MENHEMCLDYASTQVKNCDNMEDNLNECTTGILIDLEDQENISVKEKSCIMLKSDVESNSEVHNLYKHKDDGRLSDNGCEKSLCIAEGFNKMHIEAATENEELSNSGGWKTPSPKSMNIIWKEASKIIDKLHSSPIESTEVLLVDEEFPVSFPLHKHSDYFSPEFAKISEKENSIKNGISEVHKSCINDVRLTLLPESGISESNVKDSSFHETLIVETKNSKTIPVQINAESLPEEDSHFADLPLNTMILDAEESKSIAFQTNAESLPEDSPFADLSLNTMVLDAPISEIVDLKMEDSIKSTAVFKDSKPVSVEMKSKKFFGNTTLRMPLGSNKLNKDMASERKSHINADRHPTIIPESEVSKSADIRKGSCPKSISIATKLSKPVSIQMKFKNIYGSALKTPLKASEMNKENASEEKSCINENVLPTTVLGPETSESSVKQTKNHFLKNIAVSTKNSKLISTPMKSNIYGNALRTPVINKEKASDKRPKSEKDTLGKSIKNQSILHNLIDSNKRSSIAMTRTSNAIQFQQGSRQKQALCKTKSAVETPSNPKFVRRSSSFQSENRSYSVTKRLLKTCSEQDYISGKNSLGNIATAKTESSTKLSKPRMSMCPVPRTGTVLSTPLRRSNSLSKTSGAFSSQISCLNTARNVGSVAENGPHLSLLKRPVLSTSSRNRFKSRLELPSNLPSGMNDNLPRELFPDYLSMKR